MQNRAVCNIANNDDGIYSEIKLESYEINPQKYGNADHQSTPCDSIYGDFGTMSHLMEPSNLPRFFRNKIYVFEVLFKIKMYLAHRNTLSIRSGNFILLKTCFQMVNQCKFFNSFIGSLSTIMSKNIFQPWTSN